MAGPSPIRGLAFTPEYCQLDVPEPGILVVRFNRPKAMNSMPPAMHAEMTKVFDAFEADSSLRVAVVTGNGRAFSAGFDLKSAAGLAAKKDTDISRYGCEGKRDSQGIPGGKGFCGLSERAALKPIIAAVNGIAHGGGFETAISCDVIFASEEKADFALPEPKVGLFAAAGGVIKLPRMIGYHNAMAMILTGKRVGAAEGRRLGFVQEVVKHDKLLPAALDFARQTLLCSPDSIEASIQVAKAASRNMLGGFTSENEAQMLQRHLPAVKRMNQSPNRFEGPRAFSEKRTPNWEPPAPLEDFEDGGEAAGQDGDGKARAKL